MANRYWVGGSGTWDTTSTTHWSASSGGASGASVPTAADSVFFDQAGTYTVACNGALTCLDFTISAGTLTFGIITSATLAVSGSLTWSVSTINWGSIAITFNATTTGKTVATNNVSTNIAFTFNGVGGGWTLGSAIDLVSSQLAVTNGTFNSGNYAINCGAINTNNSNVRTINLGSSTVTLSSATAFFFNTQTNLTFNAGTSQINLTSSGVTGTFQTGVTFYNVAFTSTTAGTNALTGANTFNNLAVTAPSTAGVTTVTFAANQTVNGTLSTTGTAGNRRVFFASSTYGIGWTLTCNNAASLTDADFRDLYIIGTASPISGTRIGNRGNCTGITFDAPKTVYGNAVGTQNWSSNIWASSSGGSPSLTNFPLPQDTAVFDNASSTTQIILDTPTTTYISALDMSSRTTAFTVTIGAVVVYGSWKNGSGVTLSNAQTLTFAGGTTQTITSAGKTFSGGITVDTYGGTVQLADALNIGSNTLIITNGTFDTKGYNVNLVVFSSNNSNVRTINLNNSTLTLGNVASISITNTNLTFNAGTSTFTCTDTTNQLNFNATGALTFYNLTTYGVNFNNTGTSTFNNVTINAPTSVKLTLAVVYANLIINGTLTCAGSSAVQRVFIYSNTTGTKRTLTVNAWSASPADVDFRDIALAGAVGTLSGTRFGDCGNNSGITFPAPKTVYWNLAGSQNWSSTGWATSSGGVPALNNFPLAQDTAVFDNTGSAGTVTMDSGWNIGTFDASARTSAMTFDSSNISSFAYGDWKFGTGVTNTYRPAGQISFLKNGTQTITCNGVQFGFIFTVNSPLTTIQLADAFLLSSLLNLNVTQGVFDTVSYNVTVGNFAGGSASTIIMGSGTWTLSGTGTVWNALSVPTLIVGTSTIVLSSNSTSSRTFNGGGLYYNKLTIGGATATATLTITGNNTFSELESTKTVAHTIAFGNTVQNFGKWSVTGTLGNVVTITGTSTTNNIYGPAVTGVDYLAMSAWGISTTSPGEFYAGANSTGTAAAPVYRTAAPAPRTLYWVGGTGNWSSTTKWSTSSGGASGAAVPTSLDSVVFDSASSAAGYVATVDSFSRCAAFTMAGPASGTVQFNSGVLQNMVIHGSVSFAATGIFVGFSEIMYLAGNSSYTFTTNGQALNCTLTLTGINSTWTLGSALSIGTINLNYGSFSTSVSNYTLSGTLNSTTTTLKNARSISLNGSTCTLTGSTPLNLTPAANLTFNAGTSTINFSGSSASFIGLGLTYYNVAFTSASSLSLSISGANTVNNLSFTGLTTLGVRTVSIAANQTINGTLTLGAGTAAAYRTFLASDTVGTTRTLTVNALAAGAADIDFRDITIAGAAAPISGTRFGDCKGNSGITFPAAKTVYFRATGSANWGDTGSGSWSATSGGALDATQFPLAQDTAVFPAATYPASGSTTTINASYNIGTIDMSLRTSNTMTLATGTTTPAIYGNWINGTGVTLSGTGAMTFAGRGSQTITSAGVTFTQDFVLWSPAGSITLLDAFVSNRLSGTAIQQNQGTFSANGYNVTLSSGGFFSNTSLTRTVAIGSGTWVIGGSGTVWTTTTTTGLTVTGTGTISLTSASAKTFSGGGASYSGITLNQGGAGTLTISGNNTFANITNTYSATGATTINFAATTQTVAAFTATGTAGKLLTITGTSAASPASLVYTGAGSLSGVGYVVPTFVRAYPTTTTWNVGSTSTNGGSLGFVFAAGGTVYSASISEAASGIDSVVGYAIFYSAVQELASGIDSVSASFTANSDVSETSSGVDSVSSIATFASSISETSSGVDDISSAQTFATTISETGSGIDQIDAAQTFTTAISETSSGIDQASASQIFITSVSETASGVDSDSVAASTFNAYSEETASGIDTTSSAQTFASDVAESGSGVDETSALQTFATDVSETASGLDQVDSSQTFVTAVSETASGIDQVNASAVFSSSASETASGVDSVSSNPLFTSSITETASGIDAVSSKQSFASDVAETSAGIDDVSAKQTFATSVTETGSSVDQVDSAQTFRSLISETASGVDSDSVAASTFNAYASETSSGVDSISSSASFGSSVSETGSGIDAISSKQTFATDVSEAGSGVDAASAAQGFATTISETASGVDSVSSNPTFGSSISEAASGVDSIFSNVSFASSIAETASGVDSIYSYQGFAALISEAASGIDVISTAGSIFGAIFTDSASGIDVNQPNFTYNITVPEGVNAQDLIYARYLWELIDNTEVADWVNINDTQTASWSQIDDTQALNWQNVGNTQTATWSQIDNTESGNWEQI